VSQISKDAKKYNIYEQCDQFNSFLFFQSPNIPLDVVRGYASSSTSQRCDRKLKRQAFVSRVEPCDLNLKCPAASTEAPSTTESTKSAAIEHEEQSATAIYSKLEAPQLEEMIKEPAYNDPPFVNHNSKLVGNHSSATVTPSQLYLKSPRCAPGEVDSFINSMYPSPTIPDRPCLGLNNERFKVFAATPHGMDDRIANCLLLEFLKTMFMGWYREELETKCGTAGACKKAAEETMPDAREDTVTESRKSDVTRVFGWAIKELYSKWQSIRAQRKP
jgi:hypothetical protein